MEKKKSLNSNAFFTFVILQSLLRTKSGTLAERGAITSTPLMWSSMCMSKSGLTLHRMSRHGYQPIRAHTSQRDECEETALHLLSCPALQPLRVQFAIVDDVPLMKLCFSKRLAKFLIAVERNYTIPQFSHPRNPTQPTSHPPPL
ncbi:Tbingi protein [Trypanosoma theileri]|uniref:Tbingi protein n=1 Tax=Trypanosoma theileri TaxID=67003 RepID=A0A1X0P4F7_9TRYP|nr:Tbingi protein [Trypanosoma theileri]ORC91439.1 Tbingi protein [Trypanosoma theileri]